MTLGQKIKRIRTFRNMTQQELGEAIGLDAKGAANRIAQYETNYRVPKKEMILDMAKALNVSYLNFYVPVSGSAEDIIETLFWLDEDNPSALNLFEFERSNKKYGTGNNIVARYDDNDDMPVEPPVGLWFNYGLVDEFMHIWIHKKSDLKNGIISQDEYFDWKIRFPDSCDSNESD